MFSLLRASSAFVIKGAKPLQVINRLQFDKSNIICKRWSGHNAMDIEPSSYGYRFIKNWAHFYFVGALTPLLIVWSIIGIRANPELADIPEGYEPHHWEYFKHPITRWVAKYWQLPDEFESEVVLGSMEDQSESMILQNLESEIKKAITFYADYRGFTFIPSLHGERIRIGRDGSLYKFSASATAENIYYEDAYNPESNPVPTEGYPPTD